MVSKLILPIVVLISLLSVINKKESSYKSKTLHVVELYTSQGCSSCPSADKVLSEIGNKDEVLGLAFHVTYWNRLGWKDPYSSIVNDRRQQKYSKHFQLNGSYTPQMVVDGTEEFVGSNQKKAETFVNKIATPSVEITINSKEIDGKLFLSYALSGDYKDKALYYGIIENNLNTSVKAGENNRKKLKNDCVVRYFEDEMLSFNPVGEVEINKEALQINDVNSEIFAFVQDPISLKILGAAKRKLVQKEN
jgi:hypothetical protein